ncbi:MAG TPA: hypothetical protein VLQ48_02620 [Chloroflexia bacterium]|nr:hypothetical protein [Chloroflexia bacterium]
MDEEAFLNQVLAAIAEADVVSIFFPLLRRAMVIDLRHEDDVLPMVKIMPQAGSMDERIAGIERVRPDLGKIRSILGVPWLKSVRNLQQEGVIDGLVLRLVAAGLSPAESERLLRNAVNALWGIERIAFVSLVKGDGYKTLWKTESEK